jgi:hypothetical protein
MHSGRMSATGSVTAALAAVLLLTACGGDPEVPATVGPTAGADPEPTYEPTSFPYETAMELTAEERAELDELTLLIDEYTEYTSGSTDYHREGLNRLKPQLSEALVRELDTHAAEIDADGVTTSGKVQIEESLIDNYNPGESADIWVCFNYSKFNRHYSKSPSSHNPDQEHTERLFVYPSIVKGGKWVISENIYYDSDCSDIRE